MDEPQTPNDARSPERRSLAAIVFTDVVGFSRHASADEGRTYAAMNRDFALFTRLCTERGGNVANTAGDSMVMVFGSAVDAMECALAMQGELHRQEQSKPPEVILQHRIGLHIGDVILDGTNVFGDGVNIASRIQEICRPGAIAYSRAVSEIIQGKVQTGGTYLGPRRAKNIGDAIPVWEIPAIAMRERARIEAAMSAPLLVSQRNDGIAGRRSVIVIALAAVLLAGAFVLMFTVRATTERKAKSRTASILKPLPRRTPTGPPTTNSVPDTNPTSPATNSAGPTDPNAISPEKIAEIRTRLQQMKESYDFDGVLAMLADVMKGPMVVQDGMAIGPVVRRYEMLSVMRQWADNELKMLPGGEPITLADGSVIDSSTGAATIRGKDGPASQFNLWRLSPMSIHEIISALDDRPNRAFACPNGAIDAFADEYGIGAGSPLL